MFFNLEPSRLQNDAFLDFGFPFNAVVAFSQAKGRFEFHRLKLAHE